MPGPGTKQGQTAEKKPNNDKFGKPGNAEGGEEAAEAPPEPGRPKPDAGTRAARAVGAGQSPTPPELAGEPPPAPPDAVAQLFQHPGNVPQGGSHGGGARQGRQRDDNNPGASEEALDPTESAAVQRLQRQIDRIQGAREQRGPATGTGKYPPPKVEKRRNW